MSDLEREQEAHAQTQNWAADVMRERDEAQAALDDARRAMVLEVIGLVEQSHGPDAQAWGEFLRREYSTLIAPLRPVE